MLRNCFLLLALTMMTVQGAWAQRLSGSGTEENPYLISSESDWDFLAINFFGTDFKGKYYKLTADISVSSMIGNDEQWFQGTFDGDGHKITFNKGTASQPYTFAYVAPFRHIRKLTIKNLTTVGTIYTSNQYAAGIVATTGSYSNFVLTDGSYGYNWYAATGNTLGVGEAYLALPTRSVGNNANARAFNWVFVDEDAVPTGIEDLITPDTVDDDAWYTLNGVRLAGKPTARGIYVNRGKKQVIK